MSAQTFQQALGKLVNDREYRSAIESNPNKLVEDFSLDQDEISVLGQVYDKCTDGDVEGHDIYILICCCCF
jgi:hypothetical protein